MVTPQTEGRPVVGTRAAIGRSLVVMLPVNGPLQISQGPPPSVQFAGVMFKDQQVTLPEEVSEMKSMTSKIQVPFTWEPVRPSRSDNGTSQRKVPT